MFEFICPVCGQPLHRGEKSFSCDVHHSFDIARSGYVNLLLSSASGRHGDDKLMVKARAELLNKGYYDPLSAAVAERASAFCPDGAVILDAGCGEGKYSFDLLQRMTTEGKSVELVGIDISKDALVYAAKRSKSFQLAVASSAALPAADESVDLLLNIFSPFLPGEFHRVLKPGGHLLRVIPLERHLWELKKLIYDQPYENELPELAAEGFRLLSREDVKTRIELPCNEDIMSIFRMTPYYYKTGRADQQKAERAERLSTALEFAILSYEKE